MGMTQKVNHSRFDFNLMFLTLGIFTTDGKKLFYYNNNNNNKNLKNNNNDNNNNNSHVRDNSFSSGCQFFAENECGSIQEHVQFRVKLFFLPQARYFHEQTHN